MKTMASFSANVLAKFDNNYDNIITFSELMMDANRGIYTKYNKDQTQDIIRNQFDAIMGINFKSATSMQRRQALRDHGKEIASLIENVVADRMNSGWNQANARFMEYVEDINIANGDQNEFYVEDNSLLVVSKFAGNHHDVKYDSVRIA